MNNKELIGIFLIFIIAHIAIISYGIVIKINELTWIVSIIVMVIIDTLIIFYYYEQIMRKEKMRR